MTFGCGSRDFITASSASSSLSFSSVAFPVQENFNINRTFVEISVTIVTFVIRNLGNYTKENSLRYNPCSQ